MEIVEYRDPIKLLIQKELRGTIISNKICFRIKEVINFETIRYGIDLAGIERKREQNCKAIEGAMRTGNAASLKEIELNQHHEAKYWECIARYRFVDRYEIKAAGWAQMLETKC